MVGSKAARRTLQGCAFDRQLRLSQRAPLRRVVDDGAADLVERLRIGMPDARSRERLAGLDVQIEPGNARRRFRRLMKEVDADVRLVRRLVFRESRVAMNAEQRSRSRR